MWLAGDLLKNKRARLHFVWRNGRIGGNPLAFAYHNFILVKLLAYRKFFTMRAHDANATQQF
jgi:hypothetical protein